MGNSFYPSPQDVERYRRYRATSMDLHNKMALTIPERALSETAAAINLWHNGDFTFDKQHTPEVLLECCLYDWMEDGKNLVRQYIENHPATPGTRESVVSQACLQAEYHLLILESPVLGAGLYCRDAISGDELFLMDIALSQTISKQLAVLATRVLPFGPFWTTTGAVLSLDQKSGALSAALRMMENQAGGAPNPAKNSLSIVRACLDEGSAERVGFATVKTPSHIPQGQGPKRRKP